MTYSDHDYLLIFFCDFEVVGLVTHSDINIYCEFNDGGLIDHADINSKGEFNDGWTCWSWWY